MHRWLALLVALMALAGCGSIPEAPPSTTAQLEAAINARIGKGRAHVNYYVLSETEQTLLVTFPIATAKTRKLTREQAERDTAAILGELHNDGIGYTTGVIIEGTRKGKQTLQLTYSGAFIEKMRTDLDPVGIWQWTRSRQVPEYLK